MKDTTMIPTPVNLHRKDVILRTIALMEQAPESNFDMKTFGSFTMDLTEHNCGTACCIAGFISAVVFTDDDETPAEEIYVDDYCIEALKMHNGDLFYDFFYGEGAIWKEAYSLDLLSPLTLKDHRFIDGRFDLNLDNITKGDAIKVLQALVDGTIPGLYEEDNPTDDDDDDGQPDEAQEWHDFDPDC